MDKIKGFEDYIKESRGCPVATIVDNDTTLKGKILGILFQEGASSMDGLIDILKKRTNNKANGIDAYNYIKELVRQYMSDEYQISIDDNNVKDPRELLKSIFEMIIDIDTKEIIGELH